MKETREQREKRRYLAGFNNPKKDKWVRRRRTYIPEITEQKESKEGQIIGYDFDGVIATEMKGWFNNLMWKWFPKYWAVIVHKLAKHTGIMPEKNSYIISGRMGCERKTTEKQLEKWGIENVWLIINPDKIFPNNWQSMNLKIDSIKELKINVFHENDELTIQELKKEFPKLKIIKY